MSRMLGRLSLAASISIAVAGHAQAQEVDRVTQLEALVHAQADELATLKQTMDAQSRDIADLRQQLHERELDALRGEGAPASSLAGAAATATSVVSAAATLDAMSPLAPPSSGGSAPLMAGAAPAPQQSTGTAPGGQQPVGRAPTEESTRPQVAQIFDQPGVLTPQGKFVLEPSVQLGYSASDRVALIGYTIIPAILIGLIDVRQVKATTATATLTGRWGVTNRFELEGRVPYLYANTDTISREIFTGSATDRVFNTHGSGLGDVEMTARYQFNQGGPNKAYWVGWLRYKSRTGKDLFEVPTDCVTRCVDNATGTGLPLELPTGTGFESLQPGVTWLFASDPVVFFGGFSYLHNFERNNVSRTVLTGAPDGFPQTTTEPLGDLKAGDVLGFNVGLGLALNEKAAISLGYDHSWVDTIKQNGETLPGSARLMLGTLLIGASYTFNQHASLNVSLGVGVTRDTPDTTFTVRVPVTF
ncbi:acetate kinase [Cognatilysobacter terrigena]|uniref:acetate kinase n=1 Tax=Cognatilysobacter terrigena TaxID=2488749 RepID=UPI001AAD5838|nr:acetate kinase [Lysobacter terrigena]